MRIAAAQINPTLGHFSYNREKILSYIQLAVQKKADLIIFPECSIFGYHPFDLLERKEVVADQLKELKKIQAQIPAGVGVIIGAITPNKNKKGRPYFNSAVFMAKDRPTQIFHKQLLPTGDVFDEARFIQEGDLENNFFSWKGHRFFLTICEDIWAWPNRQNQSAYVTNPLAKIRPKNKTDLVINLSASPYFDGKMKLREYVTHQTAKHFGAPILYVNMVGAQDEIIFDGASFLMTPQGKKVFTCRSFEEDLNLFDLKTLKSWSPVSSKESADEQLKKAIVLGIKDFCKKIGIEKVHLGLSGGIDSALVACLAVEALGPENVVGLALPGPYSSPQSLQLAKQLAKNLNIRCDMISIKESYKFISKTLQGKIISSKMSVAHENLQARLRGMFLMAFSNAHNSLLLTTGNKSEYASGYSTMYGDMCGGLAPIADLTKKQVYSLADFFNQQYELIPEKIIQRPPTAELRPHQKDQDTLPPYDELDQSVVNLVEKAKPAKSKTDLWLKAALMRTEFKRWQAPPILKVSSHSFGRGRRWPIAYKIKL